MEKNEAAAQKVEQPAVEPQKEFNIIIHGQQKVSLAVDQPYDTKTHPIKGRQSPLNIAGKIGSAIPCKEGIHINEPEAGSTRPEMPPVTCPTCGWNNSSGTCGCGKTNLEASNAETERQDSLSDNRHGLRGMRLHSNWDLAVIKALTLGYLDSIQRLSHP